MKAFKAFLFTFLLLSLLQSQNPPQSNNQQSNQQNGQQQNAQGQNGQPANQAQNGQPGQQGQANDQNGKAQINCVNEVLRSYLLRGRFNSEPDKMVLCPAIQNNCCTKVDQQRIYHIVNDILPQRVIEYQSKMRMALAKLRQLHDKIIFNKPTFTGRPKRRSFCGTAARKVYNFPFLAFYDKIVEDLDSIRPEMDDYYKTFFCNLCDADNHPHITMKKKVVKVDGEFCQSFLKEHQELVQMLNIELTEYLISLQNLVDCNHYTKSYNLKFFDERKQAFTKELGACINHLTSKDFLKHCKTTCENIMISKVNVLFEGDFEFLMDAINIFEQFFEHKEKGDFISMKLRLFFKKFVIPRKLNKSKKARFLKELRKREAEVAHRRLKQINRKLSKSKQSVIENSGVNNIVANNDAPKNYKNVKRQRGRNGPIERNLIEVAPTKTESKKLKTSKKSKDNSLKLTDGRILTANSQNTGTNNQTNNTGTSGQNTQNNTHGSHNGNNPSMHRKNVKKAQLIYNKELFQFYSELKVMVPSEKKYIFRIKPKPIDLDKYSKVIAMHEGINANKFLGNMKFQLPVGIFYKQLFSYRKPDQPDPNLLFFLADFTPKMMEELKLDLNTKFKLAIIKKKKKKQRKTSRLLSLLDRSGKYINENFVKNEELNDVDLLKPNN